DIDDGREFGKRVGAQKRRNIQAGHVALVCVEACRGLLRLGKVGEQRLVVDVLEGRLTGSDAGQELTTRLPKPASAIDQRRSTQRAPPITLQWLSQWGQGKPA